MRKLASLSFVMVQKGKCGVLYWVSPCVLIRRDGTNLVAIIVSSF